jgi:hypothetical protein
MDPAGRMTPFRGGRWLNYVVTSEGKEQGEARPALSGSTFVPGSPPELSELRTAIRAGKRMNEIRPDRVCYNLCDGDTGWR